jgi:hypothetical protein
MKKEFIKFNSMILDYKRYIKEVEWLRYDVKKKIISILDKEFIVVEEFEEGYDRLHMVFYNKMFDIKIEIECLKKTKEVFA